MNIRWFGHAGFRISFMHSSVEKVVYIDAWMLNPMLPDDFKTVPEDADLVLVTHGHKDHAGSAPDFIKASKK